MEPQIASQILLVVAIVIELLCLYGLIFPQQLIGWVTAFWKRKTSLYFAVITRLMLGCLFILAAPATKHELVFKFLGYLTIVAAIILLMAGQLRISQIIDWVKRWSLMRLRAWLVFGLVFFGFVIYGIL